MSEDDAYPWKPARNYDSPAQFYTPLPDLPHIGQTSARQHDRAIGSWDRPTYLDDPRRFYSQQTPAPSYHSNIQDQDPFVDEAAIPFRQQPSPYQPHPCLPEPPSPFQPHPHQSFFPDPNSKLQPTTSQPSRTKPHRFLSFKTPWVAYILTISQISVFIYTLIHAYLLTGSPIETSPSFNPLIGPSSYILINTGGRYIPCMRSEANVQNSSTTIYWPCPNQTTSTPTCTLSQLCGFNDVPNPTIDGSLDANPFPNQWFRFITPIFIHAGLVHIGFNMLMQLLIGREIEILIGHVRFTLIYFASGIFGFIMGGNFAANGIVSTGASGSLFGIYAILLLDLLYTWKARRRAGRDLAFLILDVIISFVLGLLPGLDNFSHIGGFLMGLVLGVCLLKSPAALRQERKQHGRGRGLGLARVDDTPMIVYGGESILNPPKTATKITKPMALTTTESTTPLIRALSPSASHPTHHDGHDHNTHFSNFKANLSNPAYICFTLLRLACLVAAIVCTVQLLKLFYASHSTECKWCKYLSCLPVKDWCDVGELSFTDTNSTTSSYR